MMMYGKFAVPIRLDGANIRESIARTRAVGWPRAAEEETRVTKGRRSQADPRGRRFRRASSEGFDNEDDWERDWWRR